jgi:hypothetical protein
VTATEDIQMKHNPRQISALTALCVSLHDAHAIGRISENLRLINRAAWPHDADCWRVAVGDDGEPFFELSDELGGKYVRRHVSEWEKAQVHQLRLVLKRYPTLVACMQPSPEDPAIIITSADQSLDELQGGFIVIRPTAETPQSEDDILG